MTTDHSDDSPTVTLGAAPAAGPWLIEVSGPHETSWRRLERGESLVIGSGRGVDLCVADPAVSARHVRLVAADAGLTAEDLGSRNGLHVGAARVQSALLGAEDGTLVIGQTSVVARAMRPAERLPSAAAPCVPGLIGSSPAMLALSAAIRQYAPLSAPVLIHGETGCGKDVVARALHTLGRRHGAYVPLNMAAVVDSLAESELFGHVRGAFTGAVAERAGAFVQADGGTLFLDEIGELSAALQAKLLRVVEEQSVRPVGGAAAVPFRARIVSATWQPLAARAEAGRFRLDLYHRIATVVLVIPPLRARKSDLPAITRALLTRLEPELGPRRLSSAALARLLEHDWPGNVRELQSVLYRAAVGVERVITSSAVEAALPPSRRGQSAALSRDEACSLLDVHAGSISAAARAAGVARSTFRGWLSSERSARATERPPAPR